LGSSTCMDCTVCSGSTNQVNLACLNAGSTTGPGVCTGGCGPGKFKVDDSYYWRCSGILNRSQLSDGTPGVETCNR
jgi:hypothetical protein